MLRVKVFQSACKWKRLQFRKPGPERADSGDSYCIAEQHYTFKVTVLKCDFLNALKQIKLTP